MIHRMYRHNYINSEKNRQILFRRAGRNLDYKEIKKLIHLGVNIEDKQFFCDFTPLLYFASCGFSFPFWRSRELKDYWNIDFVYKRLMKAALCLQLLIDAGANIEARNHRGRSPLYLAIWLANIWGIKILLDAGADPYTIDDLGRTPIDVYKIYIKNREHLLEDYEWALSGLKMKRNSIKCSQQT
ncbi:ankyrin repeat domain-containing protein [Candidatus Riflebacteria bacterium]